MRIKISLVMLVLLYSCESPLGVGSTGVLRNDTASVPVLVGVDQQSYSELTKAATAGDEPGYKQLFAVGRVFSVAPNTSVRIIDQSWDLRQVRILDGLHKDKAVWVNESKIQRQ